MPLNAGPLLKILELEEKKGFNDSAVFGGLDKFLNNWTGEAAGTISNPGLLRRFRNIFTKNSYASLSVSQRRKWADEVRSFSINSMSRRKLLHGLLSPYQTPNR